jgi:hypothetical protein
VRRLNKLDDGLKFNDNIPNNMNLRRPGSRVSLDNENVANLDDDYKVKPNMAGFTIGMNSKNATHRDLPDNSILSARFGNSTFRSPVDSKCVSPPKGFKNSGIFNYQTGKFDVSIGPDFGGNRTMNTYNSKSEMRQGFEKPSKSVMMNMDTTLSSAGYNSTRRGPQKPD